MQSHAAPLLGIQEEGSVLSYGGEELKKKLKGLLRIIFGRTTYVLIAVLIQVGLLFIPLRLMEEYIVYFYAAFVLLGAAAVIYILNEQTDSSFKLAWVIPVLVFPVFGVAFYVFVHIQIIPKLMAGQLRKTSSDIRPFLEQDEGTARQVMAESEDVKGLIHYMNHWGGFPIYRNTSAEFFPLGEDKFEALKRELKQARRFIFMEYFIIERGIMWNAILEILEEKVRQGVEVRVLYDGTCSMVLLPYHYPQELEKRGIRCQMFSPVKPVLSTHQNNRDHRKIVVIDGCTAFTGGVNLADEYINQKMRFGHWKDTAVMLKGEAVKSFTMMFLQMWNVAERGGKENYGQYIASCEELAALPGDKRGFVMPYGDSPMDKERVGEEVYMDILNRAKRYVHIMTPYLILDDDMKNALCFAAKRGVEVIIIMPHIPDKMYAYLLARTYYPELIQAGVQIHEYTPGFVHAKEFICDDEKAVVGTINLDFRSLYLHFECGTYLYRSSAVGQMEEDFKKTLAKCQKITLKECRSFPAIKRLAGRTLRLIAPLM